MSLEIVQREAGAEIHLDLQGALDASGAAVFLGRVARPIRKRQRLVIDLAQLTMIDNAGLAALTEAILLARQSGASLRAVGAQAEVRAAIDRVPGPPLESAAPPPPSASALERLGAAGSRTLNGARDLLLLLADTTYWSLLAPFRGRFPPPGATTTQGVRIGADALFIVTLIAFLLGLIMAFQAAHQLRQFGANIFVANLVGVAMVRELGPLMTAIIVAGRSGSAIAAELGTMVVGEEVDALRTMGIEPVRFLVVPRIYAITFTQPALTLYANTVGIAGGFLIAVFYLDLSAVAYLNQTISALTLGDLITGLSKSVCFAWVIAITGCFCGLRITGGAVGVGRATTASVVAGIFAIIVVDSIFTTLSTVLG